MAAPQGGPIALRLAKQAVNLGMGLDLHSGLKVEEAYYAQVGVGDARSSRGVRRWVQAPWQ